MAAILVVVFAALSCIPLGAHAEGPPSGVESLCSVVNELGAGHWLIFDVDGPVFGTQFVEPCLPATIRAAQKRGVAVIAILAQTPDRAGAVQSDLSRYGLDFALSPLPTGRIVQLGWTTGRNGAQFAQGIFYAGLSDHAELFRNLMVDLLHPPLFTTVIEGTPAGAAAIERVMGELRALGLKVAGRTVVGSGMSDVVHDSRQSCDALLR